VIKKFVGYRVLIGGSGIRLIRTGGMTNWAAIKIVAEGVVGFLTSSSSSRKDAAK